MSSISPQRFGKYVLLRRLALGGMAEIFKAKVAGAEGFEKDLVIKRILPHYSDDETFVQMFVDEARLTAKLQHPNIVQIFDFDVVDDSYYIAMEYIEGKDLKDLLDQSAHQHDPPSVAQSVWIAIEVSKGLHHAHTRADKGEPLHIVHRDVTPSNVMISYRGDVKLMDFGIAKAAQRSTKTQAGAVKGKVAYMSPEQARGKALDGRTDVFALGVVLWEMLTGARLFLAESDFDTLNNVLKMEPPRPSSINPDVPSSLDPIVARALAKDPNQRWPSADAFGRELTRWYYAQVTDLDKEKLKPLMFRVFKRDIDLLERQSNEDDAFMSGAVVTQSEATALQPTARSGTGPGSEQRTRIDAPLGGPGRPARGAAPLDGPTATAARMTTPAQARRRDSALPWILLVVLLLVSGVCAVILLTGNKGSEPGVTNGTGSAAGADVTIPAKDAATLYLKVDPHTAKVKVDGTVVGGEVTGLSLGQRVRIVAEAPGYKRFEDIIAIEERAPVYPIKMEKEDVAHRIVIKPSSDSDEVFVDGKRLGLGAQPFEGMIGQDILVRVVPAAGGDPVTQIYKLAEEMVLINVVTPGQLLISLDPANATVTPSTGTVEVRSAGLVAVKGLTIGASITLEVKAKDHKTSKTDISLTQALQTLAIKLDKLPAPGPGPGPGPGPRPGPGPGPQPGPTPGPGPSPSKAKGSIMVAARPWAQVSVNGRPFGTTPTTIKDLAAGKYMVVLTKGQQKVSKSVVVGAGQQAQVFHDFTEM